MEIEKERAKRRQAEAGKSSAPGKPAPKDKETVPTVSLKKGQARDTVDEKVGVSGKTAEQSVFCVRVMDVLDRIGKTVNYFRESHLSRSPQRARRVEPHG